MGVWGLKLLGTYSVTVLYQWQFIIPVFISILTTAWFVWLARRRHGCEDSCARHYHLTPADIARFFAIDLTIGYTIVLILFFFIPPHDHRIIAGAGQGYVDARDKIVTLAFEDRGHWWPWSHRYFVAHADHALNSDEGETTFEAKEVPWWRALFGDNSKYFYANNFAHPIEARLYSRLNPQLLLATLSGKPIPLVAKPLKFYVVTPAKDAP